MLQSSTQSLPAPVSGAWAGTVPSQTESTPTVPNTSTPTTMSQPSPSASSFPLPAALQATTWAPNAPSPPDVLDAALMAILDAEKAMQRAEDALHYMQSSSGATPAAPWQTIPAAQPSPPADAELATNQDFQDSAVAAATARKALDLARTQVLKAAKVCKASKLASSDSVHAAETWHDAVPPVQSAVPTAQSEVEENVTAQVHVLQQPFVAASAALAGSAAAVAAAAAVAGHSDFLDAPAPIAAKVGVQHSSPAAEVAAAPETGPIKTPSLSSTIPKSILGYTPESTPESTLESISEFISESAAGDLAAGKSSVTPPVAVPRSAPGAETAESVTEVSKPASYVGPSFDIMQPLSSAAAALAAGSAYLAAAIKPRASSESVPTLSGPVLPAQKQAVQREAVLPVQTQAVATEAVLPAQKQAVPTEAVLPAQKQAVPTEAVLPVQKQAVPTKAVPTEAASGQGHVLIPSQLTIPILPPEVANPPPEDPEALAAALEAVKKLTSPKSTAPESVEAVAVLNVPPVVPAGEFVAPVDTEKFNTAGEMDMRSSHGSLRVPTLHVVDSMLFGPSETAGSAYSDAGSEHLVPASLSASIDRSIKLEGPPHTGPHSKSSDLATIPSPIGTSEAEANMLPTTSATSEDTGYLRHSHEGVEALSSGHAQSALETKSPQTSVATEDATLAGTAAAATAAAATAAATTATATAADTAATSASIAEDSLITDMAINGSVVDEVSSRFTPVIPASVSATAVNATPGISTVEPVVADSDALRHADIVVDVAAVAQGKSEFDKVGDVLDTQDSVAGAQSASTAADKLLESSVAEALGPMTPRQPLPTVPATTTMLLETQQPMILNSGVVVDPTITAADQLPLSPVTAEPGLEAASFLPPELNTQEEGMVARDAAAPPIMSFALSVEDAPDSVSESVPLRLASELMSAKGSLSSRASTSSDSQPPSARRRFSQDTRLSGGSVTSATPRGQSPRVHAVADTAASKEVEQSSAKSAGSVTSVTRSLKSVRSVAESAASKEADKAVAGSPRSVTSVTPRGQLAQGPAGTSVSEKVDKATAKSAVSDASVATSGLKAKAGTDRAGIKEVGKSFGKSAVRGGSVTPKGETVKGVADRPSGKVPDKSAVKGAEKPVEQSLVEKELEKFITVTEPVSSGKLKESEIVVAVSEPVSGGKAKEAEKVVTVIEPVSSGVVKKKDVAVGKAAVEGKKKSKEEDKRKTEFSSPGVQLHRRQSSTDSHYLSADEAFTSDQESSDSIVPVQVIPATDDRTLPDDWPSRLNDADLAEAAERLVIRVGRPMKMEAANLSLQQLHPDTVNSVNAIILQRLNHRQALAVIKEGYPYVSAEDTAWIIMDFLPGEERDRNADSWRDEKQPSVQEQLCMRMLDSVSSKKMPQLAEKLAKKVPAVHSVAHANVVLRVLSDEQLSSVVQGMFEAMSVERLQPWCTKAVKDLSPEARRDFTAWVRRLRSWQPPTITVVPDAINADTGMKGGLGSFSQPGSTRVSSASPRITTSPRMSAVQEEHSDTSKVDQTAAAAKQGVQSAAQQAASAGSLKQVKFADVPSILETPKPGEKPSSPTGLGEDSSIAAQIERLSGDVKQKDQMCSSGVVGGKDAGEVTAQGQVSMSEKQLSSSSMTESSVGNEWFLFPHLAASSSGRATPAIASGSPKSEVAPQAQAVAQTQAPQTQTQRSGSGSGTVMEVRDAKKAKKNAGKRRPRWLFCGCFASPDADEGMGQKRVFVGVGPEPMSHSQVASHLSQATSTNFAVTPKKGPSQDTGAVPPVPEPPGTPSDRPDAESKLVVDSPVHDIANQVPSSYPAPSLRQEGTSPSAGVRSRSPPSADKNTGALVQSTSFLMAQSKQLLDQVQLAPIRASATIGNSSFTDLKASTPSGRLMPTRLTGKLVDDSPRVSSASTERIMAGVQRFSSRQGSYESVVWPSTAAMGLVPVQSRETEEDSWRCAYTEDDLPGTLRQPRKPSAVTVIENEDFQPSPGDTPPEPELLTQQWDGSSKKWVWC